MRLLGYLSCIAGCRTSEECATVVVVVDWEGNLLRHETPATVAELMLEAPGNLVASAEEARRTRRALAMRADEPLWPGGVYLLFPAGRAGSRVPDHQMAALDGARGAGKRRSDRKGRRPAAGNRVYPGLVACDEEGNEEEEKLEEGKKRGGEQKKIFSGQGEDAGFPGCRRVGVARLWKPVLETIHESK